MTAGRSGTLAWLVLVVVALSVTVILLHSTANRWLVPYIPLWADQVQYLTEAYLGYDWIREQGLVAGTLAAVRLPRPQGWLLQTVASWVMTVVGSSRSVALGLNLALAVLWFGTTAYAVRRLFGTAASLVVLGLLLCTGVLAHEPGGPLDFRLDFAAACLWGTLLALVALANGREGWGVRVAIVVVGAALIVTRFISSFFLLPFGGLLVLAILATRWRSRTSWRRLFCWMMPALVGWGLVFATILVLNYEVFANYYVQGHVTGGERAVRRVVEGITSMRDDLVYYPYWLAEIHLGRPFRAIAALVFVIAAVAGLLLARAARRPGVAPEAGAGGVRPLPWLLGTVVFGLLVEYGTLTVAQVKSPVIAVMLVAPAVLLVLGVALAISRVRWYESPQAHPLFLLLGVVAVGAGLVNQWQNAQAGPPSMPPLATLREYGRLLDDAAPVIAEAGDRELVWSVDSHSAELAAPALLVLARERTGRWPKLHPGLGHGPVERLLDAADLLREAETSDVLILGQRPPGTRMIYPYDQSVQDQHEILDRYAEERLVLLGTYDIDGTPYRLFGRTSPVHAISPAAVVQVTPPAPLEYFPSDFTNRASAYSGIYQDGWIASTSFLRLKQGSAHADIVVRGMVPRVDNPSFTTLLHVLVDGQEVTRRPLGLGNFEVRAPAPGGADARQVELRFSAAQQLPPPDGRQVAAKLEYAALEDASSASARPAATPGSTQAGLLPPPVVQNTAEEIVNSAVGAVGVSADGWLAATASLALTEPTSPTSLVVRGMVPLIGDPAFTTELRVLVDGQEVARQRLGLGDFEVRAAAPDGSGVRRVELQFSATQVLPSPDDRSVGARLQSIGFTSDPSAGP